MHVTAAHRHPEGNVAPARASSAELHSERHPSPMDPTYYNGHRSRSRNNKYEEKQQEKPHRASPVKNHQNHRSGIQGVNDML